MYSTVFAAYGFLVFAIYRFSQNEEMFMILIQQTARNVCFEVPIAAKSSRSEMSFGTLLTNIFVLWGRISHRYYFLKCYFAQIFPSYLSKGEERSQLII